MPVSSGGEAGISLVFFRFFLRGIKESRHLTRGSPPAPRSGEPPRQDDGPAAERHGFRQEASPPGRSQPIIRP